MFESTAYILTKCNYCKRIASKPYITYGPKFEHLSYHTYCTFCTMTIPVSKYKWETYCGYPFGHLINGKSGMMWVNDPSKPKLPKGTIWEQAMNDEEKSLYIE